MKTILIVFSFQLLFITLLASSIYKPEVQSGIKDWSNITAKQFRN